MSKKAKIGDEPTPTERLLIEISEKLDRMTKLFSIVALRDKETDKEKIELLDSVGFQSIEIAKLLDRQANAIRAQLSRIRSKEARKAEQSDDQSGQPVQTEGQQETLATP